MNVEQANAIPMSEILAKIGCTPVKEKGADIWYHSPFRDDRTASLHVHTGKNVWYDFGAARGGSALDFVCCYLEAHNEDHTVADALRWLRNMNFAGPFPQVKKKDPSDDCGALDVKKISSLENAQLIKYLYSRGIAYPLARKHYKEAHVYNRNSGKAFYALALPNENGGYELRNKFFKGCIAPKTFSFIRGRVMLPSDIHVFEGGIDYLSALAYEKTSRLDGDAVILNSVACLPQALGYIRNYSYKTLHPWLDNDPSGQNATHILQDFARDHRLIFRPKNLIYAGHKDVNAWHMRRLEK